MRVPITVQPPQFYVPGHARALNQIGPHDRVVGAIREWNSAYPNVGALTLSTARVIDIDPDPEFCEGWCSAMDPQMAVLLGTLELRSIATQMYQGEPRPHRFRATFYPAGDRTRIALWWSKPNLVQRVLIGSALPADLLTTLNAMSVHLFGMSRGGIETYEA